MSENHSLKKFIEQLWVRKGLYPGISIGAVIGADGAGEAAWKIRVFQDC